jgi:hypothetical protein
LERYTFWLGEGHPVYPILGITAPERRNPFCWYLRIGDLPGFLKLLTPVFEERIFSSPYSNYSGEFKIVSDQDFIVFTLNAGKINQIEAYEQSISLANVEASFPNSAFIRLLFGQRSLFELDMMNIGLNYRDRFSSEMLNALFRKQISNVWPLSRFEY